MKVAHVRRTQLKPMDTTSLAMAPTGCLPSPSASIGSRCDGQFTHASFTRFPPSSTIHRDTVDSVGNPAAAAGCQPWLMMAKITSHDAVARAKCSLMVATTKAGNVEWQEKLGDITVRLVTVQCCSEPEKTKDFSLHVGGRLVGGWSKNGYQNPCC
uniref:Uncharacterized protein n=1 Tax=Leersia perrieri TaxID=77586 RepID=A0A0D9W6A5_9ORYZ